MKGMLFLYCTSEYHITILYSCFIFHFCNIFNLPYLESKVSCISRRPVQHHFPSISECETHI